MLETRHKTVLLKQSIDFLNVQKGAWYVDATVGQAGHALEIIRRGGRVLGIEANPETRIWVEENVREPELKIVAGNFRDIKKLLTENGFSKVSGVLFDLGLSTFELNNSGRGFSYLKDEPLDMRLDPMVDGPTAGQIINELTQKDLYEIFIKFGEIRDALRLSQSLVRARSIRKFRTTQDLVSLVESALRPRNRYRMLSQVFQTLRMVVNRETESLEKALLGVGELLGSGGRLVVISFHSLEDRMTKRQFLECQKMGLFRILTRNPLRPMGEEVLVNPRARSAKLRVLEKL